MDRVTIDILPSVDKNVRDEIINATMFYVYDRVASHGLYVRPRTDRSRDSLGIFIEVSKHDLVETTEILADIASAADRHGISPEELIAYILENAK